MKERYRIVSTTRCFECGSDANIHFHHVVPKILGGTKTIPLCIQCHGKVHNNDFTSFQTLAQIGRKKYVERGGKLGRKHNSNETIETFTSKPKIQKIISLLNEGKSVRQIVRLTNTSATTIVKVRKLIYTNDIDMVKFGKLKDNIEQL